MSTREDDLIRAAGIECHCPCHDRPRRLMHITACCRECPKCGRRIKLVAFNWARDLCRDCDTPDAEAIDRKEGEA